jgi:hypothetical protein
MIIKSWIFQIYAILVHAADVTMPDAQPFVTLFKYGQPHPPENWTDQEKEIARVSIVQALANPRQPSEPIESKILEA